MSNLVKTIPKGWHEFKLGEDFILSQGKYLTKEELSDTGYPVYGANGVIGHSENFMYETPTVLVSCRGANCGFVHITKPKSWVSNNSIAVLPKTHQVDPFFLYYKFYHDGFNGFITGSAQPQIVVNVLARKEIIIPPITEQRKIAEILSTVDEAIEKVDGIILKTEKIKKGLMRELFTKGIGHKKFKKTEIGAIPEEWNISKLSEVAKVERGKFSHRPRNVPEFYGGDIPFIQTGDVVNSNGKISSYTQTLNEKGLSVSKLFKKGTIVITIAANIGDTGILQFDSCFPDSLIGITPSEKIDSIFLEYYLRTQKEYLNSISTQSAQKNINLEKLNPLPIILPANDEQKKIAGILLSVDEKILINTRYRETLTKLKKGLMSDLLSGRVRVKR